MENSNHLTPNNLNRLHESFNVKKILYAYLEKVHWFVLSILVVTSTVFLINRFSTKIYQVSTTVFYEASRDRGGSSIDILEGFSVNPVQGNINSQMMLLRSYSQIRRTIEKLPFEVSYFTKGSPTSQELYIDAPFEVIFSKTHLQPLNLEFSIDIDKNGIIKVQAKGENIQTYTYSQKSISGSISSISLDEEIKPGQHLTTDYCDFQILIKSNFDINKKNSYVFKFNSYDQLTTGFQSKVKARLINSNGSLLRITATHSNKLKAIDFLNQLVKEFISKNLESKNENASKTIEFINNQLDTISVSLAVVEKDLIKFRSTNKVMDVSSITRRIFDQAPELEIQKLALQKQLFQIQRTKEYIESNIDKDSILVPVYSISLDHNFNKLLNEVNNLIIEKTSMINLKKKNDLIPIKEIDKRFGITRDALFKNLKNQIHNTKELISEIEIKIDRFYEQSKNLPEIEKELAGIERNYKLNENLYTYLLQKHAEAQLAKVSNTSDYTLVDKARPDFRGMPIRPTSKDNYINALALGFLVPALIIFLLVFFNKQLDSPEAVKQITQKPIIGYVPNNGDSNFSIQVFDNLSAPWIESFRIIRSNLQFALVKIQNPTVLVTSTLPGEGKTFISAYLSISYALLGKKTVILEFDLRKPKVAKMFGLNNHKGFTDYLIGKVELDEIIQNTEIDNLDIISSGSLPPNPSEILANPETKQVLDKLKTIYDFVIIDTAPMHPVSDTHQLSRIVDHSIYVVRDRYVQKQSFQSSIEVLEGNNIGNFSIVMNDIPMKSRLNYGYRYGYKYSNKYAYGYGSSNKQSKWKRKQ